MDTSPLVVRTRTAAWDVARPWQRRPAERGAACRLGRQPLLAACCCAGRDQQHAVHAGAESDAGGGHALAPRCRTHATGAGCWLVATKPRSCQWARCADATQAAQSAADSACAAATQRAQRAAAPADQAAHPCVHPFQRRLRRAAHARHDGRLCRRQRWVVWAARAVAPLALPWAPLLVGPPVCLLVGPSSWRPPGHLSTEVGGLGR